MAYLFLLGAIALEVLATSLLKSTEGFHRLLPSVVCLGAYGLSFALLAKIVQQLPVGLVYALWSGLGTVAIVLIGVTFLGERITTVSVAGVLMVIGGVVLLNTSGAH